MTIETVSDTTSGMRGSGSADFVQMPDLEANEKEPSEPIGSDSASLRTAAEQRSGPPAEPTVREYLDGDGRKASPKESITLARAGRDYAGALAAEKVIAESASSKELAARIDALRAEALAEDPGAAEFYGFELPKSGRAELEPSGTEGSSVSAAAESETGQSPSMLAPEVEKALRHPQVRQAIEEQLGEVERARQEYLGGLTAATQVTQISFLSQFPELASLTPEQLPTALEQMSQQDPEKFARVQTLVATGQELLAHQYQESLRQAEVAQQNFRSYARSEDARFETMLKGEPLETQHAVAMEIAASAKASGIEAGELVRLFNSEPLMRNAVFQRMMYDAGKYRLMMKARDAAVAKPLPPVQRPGTAQSRSEREHAELRTLNSRLSSSGDIKDAVALYHARKSQRR